MTMEIKILNSGDYLTTCLFDDGFQGLILVLKLLFVASTWNDNKIFSVSSVEPCVTLN